MTTYPTIADGAVVGILYKLTDPDGEVLDASGDEPLEYLHGPVPHGGGLTCTES